MSLPDITQSYPVEECTLPISGKTIKYRPLLVGDTKAFMLLGENAELSEIVNNIDHVLERVTFGELDISDLHPVDFEFLTLKLRILSKGSICDVKFKCRNCGSSFILHLDFNDVDIPNVSRRTLFKTVLPSGDELSLTFRPSISVVKNIKRGTTKADLLDIFLTNITNVGFKGKDYPVTSLDELRELVNNLPADTISDMVDKFSDGMNLTKNVHVKCPDCATETDVELRGLTDFFR